jgi:outer membrane murein-binding lipoprotein Lpp
LRQYDILKNEIKTYENNLGFLSLSSKSKNGSQLVEELNRKVDKLRADLDEIRQKIKALDDVAES